MTKVTYHPQDFHMRIEGHAGAAPAGGDLVCAGVTILGWTLIAGAEEAPEWKMHLYLNEKDGIMDVRCYPDKEGEARCRDLFDTIARGYELMAEKYPEYIKTGGYHG